jgi:hypothetical protein
MHHHPCMAFPMTIVGAASNDCEWLPRWHRSMRALPTVNNVWGLLTRYTPVPVSHSET